MYEIDLYNLPINISNEIFEWLYYNDIGNTRSEYSATGGYPKEISLTDCEATLFMLKWM